MGTKADLVRLANGGDLGTVVQTEQTLTQQLEQVLLPGVERALGDRAMADRLVRIALTEIRKTPKLARCTPVSLFGAVIQSAQLDLPPGQPLGLSWLIPMDNYNPEAKRKVTECEWWLGYTGMVELARRSGRIGQLMADVVREGDTFDVANGTNGGLQHHWDWRASSADRGPIVASYAYWRFPNGGDAWLVKSIDDVHADHRDHSRAWKHAESGPAEKGGGKRDSPWHLHYGAMVRKSLIRAAFPWLPVSAALADAVSADERVSRWTPDGGLDIGDAAAELVAAVPAPDPDEPTSSDKG